MEQFEVNGVTCIVRYFALPRRINGFTAYDGEGVANIYINDALSQAMQRRTLEHELSHVREGDSFSELGIRQVEKKDR